ncbi:M48 family metallopeptidase [Pseudoduganella sp. RAF19]|uniref:M48 family metallopeptidase n=1 Tax=Pseudoduganella sp. RAF19 TaxID=3233052 RepID=UPI003F9636A3
MNAHRFPRRLLAALLSSLLITAPNGQAQSATTTPNLPTLGDASREDLSPVMEQRLGEEIMNDIRRDRDYLDDPPIIEYLNNLGQTLVAARPGARGDANYSYFFFVVRDPMLNAFALPGGNIGVHSSLLLAAQTESELASVLSHEIGHVAQRHIARQIGAQKTDALIPLAAMILAALASKASSDAAIGVFMGGQGLAIQRQLNFSRDAEREADRVGFQIMGEAGYDVSGMVGFFQRLQQTTRNYSDIVPAWLQTHPLTTERIADIQARIRETPFRPRVDGTDFFLVRSRARVLQDESEKGLAESKAFFQTQTEAPGRQQVAAGQYGLSMVAMRQHDYAGAQQWLDKARATLDKAPTAGAFSSPMPRGQTDTELAFLSLEIKLAQEDNPKVIAAAVKEAEAAHARYPLSRGLAWQYADAMIKGGKSDEAALFLRDQLQMYRSEPELYDFLAQAYSKQGKIALQHIALAESYVLQGGTMAALDQLGLARKAPDATYYDQSVIDGRERELQAKRREMLGDKKKDKDKD